MDSSFDIIQSVKMNHHYPSNVNQLNSSKSDYVIPNCASVTSRTQFGHYQTLCCKRSHSSDIYGVQDLPCAEGALTCLTPCGSIYYHIYDNTCRDNCEPGTEEISDIISVAEHLLLNAGQPIDTTQFNHSTFHSNNGNHNSSHNYMINTNNETLKTNDVTVLDCRSGRNDIANISEASNHFASTNSCRIRKRLRNSITDNMNSNCSRNDALVDNSKMSSRLEISCTLNNSLNNSTEINNKSLCQNETGCAINSRINSTETQRSSLNNSQRICTQNSSRNNIAAKRNSINPTETTRNTPPSLKTTPAGSLIKPSVSLLPPCRICGAKASGFHYGVNSCEACKGFFRRALKRPLTFSCTKNKKCDVNGNKRSSCRFCRYKRCLRLGMSIESIKTGRYSHNKRTRDTIEVKRLQNYPNVFVDELDLDATIACLSQADDRFIVSSINLPKDVIYSRQLEYHNAFIQCDSSYSYPESPKNKHYTSNITDNAWSRKDGNVLLIKDSIPPLPSSKLNPDLGNVCELNSIVNGTKDGTIGNEARDKNEVFGEPTSILVDRSVKTNQTYIDHLRRYENQPVENHQQQCSTSSSLNKGIPLHTRELEHKDHVDFEHFDNIDLIKQQLIENTKHYSRDVLLIEKDNNQSNYGNVSKTRSASISSGSEIKEVPLHYLDSYETRVEANAADSKSRLRCELDNERCVHHKDNVELPTSSPNSEIIYGKLTEEHLAINSTRHSEIVPDSIHTTLIPKYKSHNLSRTSGNGTIFDETKNYFRTNISKGQVSKVDCMPTLEAETELLEKDEFAYSVSMRRELQDVAVLRARRWIRGYVDFAKAIRGFTSLTREDQATLLKHAWDEVWILGTYSGYNSDLAVVTVPSGRCFHGNEMERMWGENYARIAFTMADILKRTNLTPGLITLLKAICIVSPDRCQLLNPKRVGDIHWMMVSCLLRHIQMTYPGDHVVFPRMVSVLTSLRDLSEMARQQLDNGRGEGWFDYGVVNGPATFF